VTLTIADIERWDRLTKEQRDWLFEQDPTIGDHPGMPWGSADDVGKDYYNRIHLDQLHAANQAELDRLAAERPGWMDGSPGTPNPNPPGFREWKQQWDKANQQQQMYRQVDRALESADGMPRLLGVLDDQGHAAVAIKNPDTATRTATFVPGAGQDLTRLEFSTQKSEQMLYPTLAAGDVSVTTWMGYDRPMNIITDAPSTSYARRPRTGRPLRHADRRCPRQLLERGQSGAD
jgi:Alpha/beta hydrolase